MNLRLRAYVTLLFML